MLVRVQLAFLALSFGLQACGGTAPSEAERAAYAEKPPPIGQEVTFFMYTHCGVESARIGGRWWHVVDPLYSADGSPNPPAGWDNPYQRGQLVLESADRATFEARGVEVVLKPASSNKPLRMCM